MKTCLLVFITLVFAALLPGCSSGPNTQRGAATGAAAGAIIGGIIGHQSGEAGAGAALGAAAGGLAGGAYGNRRDNAADANGAGQDSYGYTVQDYLGLLTGEEREILRERAPGVAGSERADYLTSQEKANLRARGNSHREISR